MKVNQHVDSLDFPIRSNEDYQAFRKACADLPPVPKLIADPAQCPLIYKGDGQEIRLMVKGEESSGRMMVTYVKMQKGAAGAPRHHQPVEDEFWFCVEGEFLITVGEVTQRIGPGAFAYIPRGVTHAFEQIGDVAGAMFTVNCPAGHERGFIGMSKLLAEEASPEQMNKHLADHDFMFE